MGRNKGGCLVAATPFLLSARACCCCTLFETAASSHLHCSAGRCPEAPVSSRSRRLGMSAKQAARARCLHPGPADPSARAGSRATDPCDDGRRAAGELKIKVATTAAAAAAAAGLCGGGASVRCAASSISHWENAMRVGREDVDALLVEVLRVPNDLKAAVGSGVGDGGSPREFRCRAGKKSQPPTTGSGCSGGGLFRGSVATGASGPAPEVAPPRAKHQAVNDADDSGASDAFTHGNDHVEPQESRSGERQGRALRRSKERRHVMPTRPGWCGMRDKVVVPQRRAAA